MWNDKEIKDTIEGMLGRGDLGSGSEAADLASNVYGDMTG